MELKQLMLFRVAAQELNFTRTAEILNYAQSTVTAQIQSLESELGVALFERLGKRVILTEYGRRFKTYADQILALSDEAKNVVGGQGEPNGTLVICAQETQCTYRLPLLLKEFQTRHPNVQLMFRPGVPDDEIRVLLSNGELDVAFLLEPPVTSNSLIVEPLCPEPIVLVCQPGHVLSTLPEVKPSDLVGQTVLLIEDGCHYRRAFEEALNSAEVRPSNRLELGSVEAIKRCVMEGIGLAVLPEVAVAEEVNEGRLAVLPWTGCDFSIVTQLAWHKDKWMSPALKAFIDLAREVLPSK
ncbi:LysR family transcriptional regulator [Alicyclobacillus herbarius]|uniref:LysR family transcriptional regulator n=1 Tax=Alicyclobacillus herbarius TaxID=122960 RepID=UPI0004167584|nr:LysR family transcriptional regulator [Alicyclobacillus herbarius]